MIRIWYAGIWCVQLLEYLNNENTCENDLDKEGREHLINNYHELRFWVNLKRIINAF